MDCLLSYLSFRKSIGEVCHNFKAVFVQVKERSSKVLAFAKLLCKDLEIAADFKVLVSAARLMEDLQKSNHHQVPHSCACMYHICKTITIVYGVCTFVLFTYSFNMWQVVVSNQICNMLFVPDAVASNHE